MPILRTGVAKDAVALAELGARTFLATYARPDFERPEFEPVARDHVARTFTPELIAEDIRRSGVHYFVLEKNKALVGFARLVADLGPPDVRACSDRAACVHRLYLDVELQGSGQGARLLERCETFAAERGHDATWLTVWEVNHKAVSFYLRRGYQQIGQIPWVSGDYSEPDLLMWKPLAC